MSLLRIGFDITAEKADKDIPAEKTWMKKHDMLVLVRQFHAPSRNNKDLPRRLPLL
jgi:hypothetical protein